VMDDEVRASTAGASGAGTDRALSKWYHRQRLKAHRERNGACPAAARAPGVTRASSVAAPSSAASTSCLLTAGSGPSLATSRSRVSSESRSAVAAAAASQDGLQGPAAEGAAPRRR
jgi:hypothetical protein